jgi:transcription elongation factor GreA
MEDIMAQARYLTPEGKKQIEEKLEFYKRVKRPEVIKKIGIAREFGDLSENAEYDAAKEEQGIIEAEIKNMEDLLLTAIIIDKDKLDCSKVHVGTTVKLYDEEFDEDVEYSIVGTQESDPKRGIISNESPLGAALLGHKVGEFVVVKTPSGDTRYKILEIRI